jgi:uncharacterized protein YbgA (DUF1722 family)/uncharacterized protein YbbK (DUF523 family)
MREAIKMGISACLLGEPVRYDGSHKLDHYLKDTLGAFVQWVAVCPEVECGMSTPREAVRLVGSVESPRLMTSRTHVDKTAQMLRWSREKLDALEKEDLCGFVFKSDSPSSGLKNIRVYNEAGMAVSRKGSGIFARAFTERFPLIPAEDDGRLRDPKLRENFIERVFVYFRWKQYVRTDGSLGGLVDFHARHKLTLMAHSPKALQELGRLVAQAKKMPRQQALSGYLSGMMQALENPATAKKNTNVLEHIAGYFKEHLTAEEKQELLEVIGLYHKELVPLIVPVVLLCHYVRKYRIEYLSRQAYLYPHPQELMLRNHV